MISRSGASTADIQVELRRWLMSLDRSDLGVLVAMSESLRSGVPAPGHAPFRRSLTRREWLGVKTWLTKVPSVRLTQIATEVVAVAVQLLLQVHSCDPVIVDEPDEEQLSRLLATVGRPAAQAVLFGLLLSDGFSAHSVAWRNRGTLEQAARHTRHSVTFGQLSTLTSTQNPADQVISSEGVEQMDYVDPTQTTTVPRNPDSLAALLIEARREAESVAGTLRSAVDIVMAGSDLPTEIDSALSAYRRRRQAVLSALGDDVDRASVPTFDTMNSWIEEVRAKEVRRAEQEALEQARSEEVADLERKIRELQAQRDGLLSPLPAQEAVPETEPTSFGEHDETGSEIAPTPEPTWGRITEQPNEPALEDIQAPSTAPADELAEEPQILERATDELEYGFPWEQGVRPLAVELVSAGRLAEAYWLTAMSGEPDRRALALRFAVAAFGTRDATEATTVQAALDINSQSLHEDYDAAAVVTVALLRVALLAGWAHPLLNQIPTDLTRHKHWDTLIEVCVRAAESGHRVDRATPLGVAGNEDSSTAQAELGRRAKALLSDLPRRKNAYERASRVLRRLAMTGQPLDTALRAVIAWADDDDTDALETVVRQLSEPGVDEGMIEAADAAVRTPKQAKEPIVAGARRGLLRAIEEVRTIVQEADAVNHRLIASAVASEATAHQLARAIEDTTGIEVPAGMTGAAMSLLRSWLNDPVSTSQPAHHVTDDGEPSADVLLSLADLPRDETGRPVRDDPQVSRVLASLSEPVDPISAVSSYCHRGDLFRASRVVELVDDGMWPGSARTTELCDLVNESRKHWEREHRIELLRTGDLFARIRGQNLLDQNSESRFARRLEALSSVPNGMFDNVMAGLEDLAEALRTSHHQHVQTLRANLAELCPQQDSNRDRIEALLDEGDAVTAAEFLSFLRAGQPLPTHAAAAIQDVATFARLLTIGEEKGFAKAPSTARQWADLASELAADSRELAQSALQGIDDWDSLTDPKRHHGERMANAVRTILTTLGLQNASRPRELDPRARRGFRRFRVQGKPADGSYVSSLGSAATDYMVTLVLEERRGRSVLDVLGHEDAGRANLVLYTHPLDLSARRALASEAPNSPVQAVVIDPAVLGWVAATRPGSWRATQRVTLPWTALNPYTPFVAGLVPPEVFVGREDELAAVTDPSGGLFLYGGRQLGKSALLRRVEATFDDDLRHAVYLDLKGRGIGEAEPASRIWRELARELTQRGVLSFKGSNDAPPDVVVGRIKDWLNVNEGRRLLLLADEADAFLTADSRALPGSGGAGHFPNVLRLKELMESTGRRFKVVFAGLHQVQRFGHLSNVPLVHGGPDILVGPLDQRNARKLVEEPMAALGYVFEKPELVWRLLSATNYQASLIQIFCDELVTTLHKRTSRTQAIPVPITDDDVENVRASDRVRNRIAERLRITINLEDRYRVLALVIAWLSLNDSFGTAYEPKELLEYARIYWRDGFVSLNVSQVSIYLSEMVGLGLLMQLPGENRYVVRSPNVVNMLGSMEALERELGETDFVLPYEYNPREARRLLHVDDEGRQFRSPLTDGQLADLVKANELSVITGTVALGVERASSAIKEYAETRGNNVDVCRSVAEVAKSITNSHRRARPTVLVADVRGWTRAEIEEMTERLEKTQVIGVVIVDPADLDSCREKIEVSGEPMRPDRWTSNAIRSWPECPFDSVESRGTLIDETGGWPDLVEIAIWRVDQGATQAQALGHVRTICSDKHLATTMLRSAGFDEELVRRVEAWVDFMLPGDPMPLIPADVAEILGTDIATTNDLLAELSMLDVLDVFEGSDPATEKERGVALNKVIHRCIETTCGER